MINAAKQRRLSKKRKSSDDDSDNGVMKKPSSSSVLKRPSTKADPTIVKADPASKKIKAEPASTTIKADSTAAHVKTKPKAEPTLSKACATLTNKIDVSSIFKKLRKMRWEDGMYKNKYASRAYAAGRKAAEVMSKDSHVIKEFSGIQYRKAAKEWDDATRESCLPRNDTDLTWLVAR